MQSLCETDFKNIQWQSQPLSRVQRQEGPGSISDAEQGLGKPALVKKAIQIPFSSYCFGGHSVASYGQ